MDRITTICRRRPRALSLAGAALLAAVAAPGAQAAAATAFPTAGTTGVPAGWTPSATYTRDLKITTPGAVIEDVRLVNANLIVGAENVTIRRVELQGGRIVNDGRSRCRNGSVIEDVSILRGPGQVTTDSDPPAVGLGGYTARRVKIDSLPEGFRAGGASSGCKGVTIEDSFARIVSPDRCIDWHGDGVQGYDGPPLTIRNVTIEMIERADCGGTAPFFYPAAQGNASVDIDGLFLKGGGFPFRLGMPGSVRGLRIADHSWGYGPIDVDCSLIDGWDAEVVAVGPDDRPTAPMRPVACNTKGGR